VQLRRATPGGRRGPAASLRLSWDFFAVVGLLIASLAYGMHRWRELAAPEAYGATVRCLVIQPGIRQQVKLASQMGDEASIRFEQEQIASLTRIYVPAIIPDLVVWPESSLPLGYAHEESHRIIDDLLKEGPFSLMGGADTQSMDGLMNSVFLARGSSENVQLHGKGHLVPFGEYLPLRPILGYIPGLEAMLPGDFTPGLAREPLVLTSAKDQIVGQIVPLVCFEDTVGAYAREFVREEPQLLVNLTNDGWFPHSAGPEQHLTQARFRCIELRRPMVRATNTGQSCVINAFGSLAAPSVTSGTVGPLPMDQPGGFTADVRLPATGQRTLYSRVGDAFSAFCAALALLWTLRGACLRKTSPPTAV
jgi:apolipoprotein N-acyltransferase